MEKVLYAIGKSLTDDMIVFENIKNIEVCNDILHYKHTYILRGDECKFITFKHVYIDGQGQPHIKNEYFQRYKLPC